jgi:regulator of sigma E protease
MFGDLRTILAFVVDIGVLIFVHELGHYALARWSGVTVEVFSIGFGPALVKWTAKSGTIWQVSALPLGGYVKMQGWGEDASTGPVTPGSFGAASLGAKAAIVAAGPLANLLLAIVLYAGLFMTAGQPLPPPPVFAAIEAGSAAAAAHLQVGDRVLAINGAAITDFSSIQDVVASHPDASLTFSIQRGTQDFTQAVTVGDVTQDGTHIGHLGVGAAPSVFVRLSPPAAIIAAFAETWRVISGWAVNMGALIVHHQGLSELAGPLGIAQITGQVAAMGIAPLISFVAFLSVNLGLVNLIPIPILDGGHLFFYACEAVLRREVPERVREYGLRFGAALILMLVALVTFNDLGRLGAVAWLTHLLG